MKNNYTVHRFKGPTEASYGAYWKEYTVTKPLHKYYEVDEITHEALSLDYNRVNLILMEDYNKLESCRKKCIKIITS